MAKFQDLTGQSFNAWTVLYKSEKKCRGLTYWHCSCVCGTEKDVAACHLKSGKSASCGCMARKTISEKISRDFTGMQFGRLTAVERLPKYKNDQTYYKCKCACGNDVIVSGYSLRTGNTKSCGCYGKQMLVERTAVDLTGKRFGKLVVLERFPHYQNDETYYKCQCDCGNQKMIRGSALQGGNTKSCGCLHNYVASISRTKDLTGQRFGRLTVIERIGSRKNRSLWRCKCDCGNETEQTANSLLRHNTKSCGCLLREYREESQRNNAENFQAHIGETSQMRCGLSATITGGKNMMDMTIMFEDGAIKEHVTYVQFKKSAAHPAWAKVNPKNNTYMGYTGVRLAYRTNENVYYYCTNADGVRDILTPKQMYQSVQKK